MIRRSIHSLLAVAILAGGAGFARAADPEEDPFASFQFFIGKTWRGTFANSTAEKPMTDISRWERVLNGQAIRILHSVNDGEYGGETMIIYDRQKKSLVFYYFTTAGFFTQGTATFENGKFVSTEQVVGNENGITEVKGFGEILPDGRLHSKAQYLQNGTWVDGHEILYAEDPTAQVIFK